MTNEQQTFEQGVSKRLSMQISDLSLKNAELAEAISQLDNINASLEKENENLLSRISELEKENENLSTRISSLEDAKKLVYQVPGSDDTNNTVEK